LVKLIQTLTDELEHRTFASSTTNNTDVDTTCAPLTRTDEEIRQLIGQARSVIQRTGVSSVPQSIGNPSQDYQMADSEVDVNSVAESPPASHLPPSTTHTTTSRVMSPLVHSFDDQDTRDSLESGESVPQSSWPYPTTTSSTDADTLMHMSLFSDQFWNEALVSSFKFPFFFTPCARPASPISVTSFLRIHFR
jgi:hypothetical protein